MSYLTSTTCPSEKKEHFLPSRITTRLIYDAGNSSTSLLEHFDTHSFSFGNPIIQMIKGSMSLLKNDVTSVCKVQETPAICVLGVKNSYPYAKFCDYCEPFIKEIKEIRFVRCDEEKDKYSILISFKEKQSAYEFHHRVNEGSTISKKNSWRAHFILGMSYEKSATQNTEDNKAKCPCCDVILGQDGGVIVTLICNHSFHLTCISCGPSCFVCYSSPQQSANLIGVDCSMGNKVLICLHCEFAFCKRPQQPDDIMHLNGTTHRYFIEPETQRVWDAHDQIYVHTRIQSNTNGDDDTDPMSKYKELFISELCVKKTLLRTCKEKCQKDMKMLLSTCKEKCEEDEEQVKLEEMVSLKSKESIEWDVSGAVKAFEEQVETLQIVKKEIKDLLEKQDEEKECIKNLEESIKKLSSNVSYIKTYAIEHL